MANRSSRSRSRTNQTVITNVPRHVPAKLVTSLSHFDGFSGMGIPHMCVLQTLRKLWNEGYHIHIREIHSYEIDELAIKAYQLLVPTISTPGGTTYHGPWDVKMFPQHARDHILENCEMVTVFEMVPAAVRVWHHAMTHSFGQSTILRTSSAHAARERYFYTTPALEHRVDTAHKIPPHHIFGDFSCWPAHGDSQTSPPTLRAIYPELLRRQQSGSVSAQDKQTLSRFQIRTFDNAIKYSGPLHWAQWLGLEENMTDKLLLGFPCEGGQCGWEVLCSNCSDLCTILGRAWNYEEGTEIIERMLRKSVANMAQSPRHINLYTSGSPCTRISRGIFCANNILQLVGPHAFPSNLMWDWHAGLLQHSRRLHFRHGLVNHFTPQFAHHCSEDCVEAITLQQAKAIR